jgi:hypothetical protein
MVFAIALLNAAHIHLHSSYSAAVLTRTLKNM